MIASTRSSLAALALAVGVVLATSACGSDTPPTGDEDGGNPDVVACEDQTGCASGQRCEGGICVENKCTSTAECPSGATCNLLKGECEIPTLPDGGPVTTPDGGIHTNPDGGTTTGCTTKFDCPDSQICKASKCQNPSASNGCNADLDCPRGKICNFSKQCEAGCTDARDCTAPNLCHPQKFVCEACSATNPCPNDAAGKPQTCSAGACQGAVACTTTAECAAKVDGQICTAAHVCGNCANLGDCDVDPYKGTLVPQTPGRVCSQQGLCVKSSTSCTDAKCQQSLGPLGHCNTTNNTCEKYGCLADTDCQSPQICDTAQHTCGTAAQCDATAQQQCQQQCATQQLQCNPATCQCGGGASGTGQAGDACVAGSDCATGFTCFTGSCIDAAVDSSGAPCDTLSCIGGSCVSGADPSISCSATGCLFSLLAGGGGGGGGGASCSDDSECQPGETCQGAIAIGPIVISKGSCAAGTAGASTTPCL
jgi:hypothetical protein